MSLQTVELLGRKQPPIPRLRKWLARFEAIADLLVGTYGTPTLGNFRDPVREIFYILLSARTTDAQYRKTYKTLHSSFPSLADLAKADVDRVTECIAGGGLANKRSRQVIHTATMLIERLGDNPAAALRAMGDEEVFEFLVNLPGMGPKSALCVMMCSLNADVFPVDVNVQRIAARVGAIRLGLKHYQAQEILPGMIPPGRSKELHVGMVVLGRKVCLPRKPLCPKCPIAKLCNTGKLPGDEGGSRTENEINGKTAGN